MSKMTLSEELQWRGFVNQTTYTDVSKLDEKKLKFYCGYDASADSLTVGNLATIMFNKVFIRHGYEAVLLAGGATSLIGDPGGKDAERPLQSTEVIEANVDKVRSQVQQLVGKDVKMVNNLDWYKKMNVVEYLRDIGKHFSMTPLVQRDYIAKRMGEGGAGISYTEFSYTILQGYDFLHLYKEYGVTLQLSGADQWGNALSGVDLVRRVEGAEAHALTCPLIINKTTGKKFGKSEEGAVWLDPAKTSAYKFYQFWLNADDDGVEDYLKVFTELDKDSIDEAMEAFTKDKAGRHAQKTLAYEVTKLIHGEATATSVRRVSETLFAGGSYANLTSEDFAVLQEELPTITAKNDSDFVGILVDAALASSNSEARRFISQGAVYLNGTSIGEGQVFSASDTVNGFAILRRGKNSNVIIKLA